MLFDVVTSCTVTSSTPCLSSVSSSSPPPPPMLLNLDDSTLIRLPFQFNDHDGGTILERSPCFFNSNAASAILAIAVRPNNGGAVGGR